MTTTQQPQNQLHSPNPAVPPSSSVSYLEFQQQAQEQRLQERLQAQQAILRTGADTSSQQLQQIGQQILAIGQELLMSHNQLQTHMQAQQRQLQDTQQKIQKLYQQVQSVTASLRTAPLP